MLPCWCSIYIGWCGNEIHTTCFAFGKSFYVAHVVGMNAWTVRWVPIAIKMYIHKHIYIYFDIDSPLTNVRLKCKQNFMMISHRDKNRKSTTTESNSVGNSNKYSCKNSPEIIIKKRIWVTDFHTKNYKYLVFIFVIFFLTFRYQYQLLINIPSSPYINFIWNWIQFKCFCVCVFVCLYQFIQSR